MLDVREMDHELVTVYFDESNLQNASFKRANLANSHLIYVNFQSTNWEEANLEGASLWFVDFTDAVNLHSSQLRRCRGMWGCILPDGSKYDGHFDLSDDAILCHLFDVDINDSAKNEKIANLSHDELVKKMSEQ